ncbi:type III pantothenate kinase [Megalodesulfovibrio gigas]|uniref:Type III pantothenate kinase n=1 Tax=Megalodesulfovibrio gigas (strain ATCC 19364 / DSM 1382 / NCIMB 9332 / VKM B-1759) TaxID=1121448 RepID=T2G8L0_MEGG1|nr:type III pantothenate kinase [Megalodesulfovibrio gigas]AGW12608.1 putative pantothenate kinase [Megalodesulfovibrio gigas DSM 1382 = ATCC 19364]
MKTHRLLFDVGNTTVSVGLTPLDRPDVLTVWQLPSTGPTTPDAFGLSLYGLLQLAGVPRERLAPALACSVAPSFDGILRQACASFLGVAVRFVHQEVPIPLENRYERPSEVGADRLMAAWAVCRLLPAASHLVVDFGTATTLDCVRGSAYLGGLICPGVLSSARALSSQTAKLPQIDLDLKSEVVAPGRSTKESLSQGLVFGFASMIDGLVDKLTPVVQGGLPDAPLVVAAGGLAAAIAPHAARIAHVRPALILEGMALLALDVC